MLCGEQEVIITLSYLSVSMAPNVKVLPSGGALYHQCLIETQKFKIWKMLI
jgi:hypothetical protein